MSTRAVVVYSSSSGGVVVQKNTVAMVNMVTTVLGGKQPKVVYLDIDAAEKQTVWAKSGKKGVYPLLFVDGEFVGDYETVEAINENEKLHGVLGVPGH